VDTTRRPGFGETAGGNNPAACVPAGLGTPRVAERGIKDLQAVAFMGECFQRQVRILLRWHTGSHLRDADGRKRSPGRISGKKRAFGGTAGVGCQTVAMVPGRRRGHPRDASCL
jgi:hypothetical protein